MTVATNTLAFATESQTYPSDFLMKNRLPVEIGCLKVLLRPIARFCLRRSIGFAALTQLAKAVFVEVAESEMQVRGEKVNVSRLSVMTGIQRREVMKLHESEAAPEVSGSFAARVLGQWEQDRNFLTSSKRPRVLSLWGENSEFRQLVSAVSQDLNPGTILFELQRIGAVEVLEDRIRLKKRSHVIKGDPIEGFGILANDSEDLLLAVEENVFESPAVKNLHARTEYDNIRKEDIGKIRRWILEEGAAFHARARKFLAQFDNDVNPKPNKEGGARVMIGTFSRTALGEE